MPKTRSQTKQARKKSQTTSHVPMSRKSQARSGGKSQARNGGQCHGSNQASGHGQRVGKTKLKADDGQHKPFSVGLKSATAKQIAAINNEFGLQMFKIVTSESEDNCIFSPLSITAALAMTYMGTRGNTAKQIESALKLSEEFNIHHGFKDLISDIFEQPSKDLYKLKLANRLYGQKGFNFVPEYVTSTHDLYDAKLESVDFEGDTESAREAINAWVEEKTAGQIQDLIPSDVLDDYTRMVLVNAIYFHGMWADQFAPGNTENMAFHLSASDTKVVPMMYMERTMHFYDDKSSKCKVLSMGYQGESVNMLIVLPNDIAGLSDLESKLSTKKLQSWNNRVKPRLVQVTLPKFKFTKGYSFVQCLKNMGITDLFETSLVDLSGLLDDNDDFVSKNLAVSDVFHKAFLEVNEQGTEAAATTRVTVAFKSCRGAPKPEPLVFRADHPFLFFIQDHKSHTVILMGRVTRPLTE